MKRKIEAVVSAWLEAKDGRPLLIKGPRRVGKTYIAKEYLAGVIGTGHVVYLDFQTDLQGLESLFAGRSDVGRIVGDLELYLGRSIDSASDVLVFDEVQLCDKALNSLRFFAQSDYRVIATGSLLGVTLSKYRQDGRRLPFPSDVRHVSMHPMDFEEFLWALGQESMAQGIRTCYEQARPYPRHEEALSFYRQYLVVGGMPRAVASYAASASFEEVREVQAEIDQTYVADMPMSQAALCRAIWDSVPRQLAREGTRKFKYADVARGGRANRFEEPLDWLESAGVIDLVRQTNSCRLPLQARDGGAFFKVYMADTGLMYFKYGLTPNLLLMPEAYAALSASFRGALAENYVMQQLAANGVRPYYWTPGDASGEIEFLASTGGGELLPIEVKSGENVRSRSLKAFMAKTSCPLGLRVSAREFGQEGSLKSVPLYAAFCIEPS